MQFNTCVITGDSIINGVDERKISSSRKVKVRSFPGARIQDMYHYLMPIIEKEPDYIILHIGTNDAVTSEPQQIVDDLLALKLFVKEKLKNCKVIISLPTKRTDNAKAASRNLVVIQKLLQLKIQTMDNSNILDQHLSKRGLHLNNQGTVRLAMNFISHVKRI